MKVVLRLWLPSLLPTSLPRPDTSFLAACFASALGASEDLGAPDRVGMPDRPPSVPFAPVPGLLADFGVPDLVVDDLGVVLLVFVLDLEFLGVVDFTFRIFLVGLDEAVVVAVVFLLLSFIINLRGAAAVSRLNFLRLASEPDFALLGLTEVDAAT